MNLLVKIVLGVFLSISFVEGGITEGECEAKEGIYCREANQCLFFLKETCHTYNEAVALCAARGALLPIFDLKLITIYHNCVGESNPWQFPLTAFCLRISPLFCIAFQLAGPTSYVVLNQCEYNFEVNVACVIDF